MSDWNTQIIEEFRANDGVVGGPFDGWTLLLLHHTGAKTGTERVSPLAYQQVGDDVAIFASRGGDPSHPDWFHNLVAHPQTVAEIGAEAVNVTARVTTGDERERIWSQQKAKHAEFAEYEVTADGRVIPVVILERR